MRLVIVAALCASTLLIGCSTHRVRIGYQTQPAAAQRSRALPAIAVGKFVDERGDDAERASDGVWIGAIRGGYGNTIKTVLVEQPLRDMVATSFVDALKARSSLADENSGAHVISGSVTTFACKQYVRRDCTVALDVVLSERLSGREIVKKKYDAYEFDGSVWAADTGIFGSVDKLRDLASRTLTVCVDKVLDDDVLIEASHQHGLGAPKEQSRQARDRFHELKTLFDQGLLTKEEYESRRAAVLDDL